MAIQSSLARAWGLEGYAGIQRTVRETDVSSDADFQRFYNRFYRVRRNAEWQLSYYAIMEREKANPSTAFGDVLREMHELTGNVEASFTSKMIATLRPDKPGQPGARKARPEAQGNDGVGQARERRRGVWRDRLLVRDLPGHG